MKKVETQFGISATADFEENTWTFQIPDRYQVWAGEFAIVDKKVYDDMVARLADDFNRGYGEGYHDATREAQQEIRENYQPSH